jgi:hypothetical protein
MPDKLKTPEEFYSAVLQILQDNSVSFLLGGTYAMRHYIGINRRTKDLDIFCKAGDSIKILSLMKKAGFQTEVTDARWLAKIYHKNREFFIDLIFSSIQGVWHVSDDWFEEAEVIEFLGYNLSLIPPLYMILSKIYFHDVALYHEADVNHIILRRGKEINWKKLLNIMEMHWELLFAQIINFRFIYPSESAIIPMWLMEEFAQRLSTQLKIPTPKDKICRGPLISRTQYIVDIEQWGYKDIHNPD